MSAVPLALATAAALPALALAPAPAGGVSSTRGGAAIPALVAPGFVALTLAAAQLAGPAAAGTIAAFPALSTVLALALTRRGGREAGAAALHGAIGGLRGYLAFCVVAPVLGVAAGLCACAVVTLAGGRDVLRVDRRRPGDVDQLRPSSALATFAEPAVSGVVSAAPSG